MDYNRRLYFYLGANKFIPNSKMNEYSIKDLSNINLPYNVYDIPLKNLLIETNNASENFSFARGDVWNENQQHNWTLSKNRCETNTSSILLRCLNFNRHWNLYYNKPYDIPFENKSNIIFWRGTTTGVDLKTDVPRKVNRFVLVEKWFNKKKEIDIGFSFIHKPFLESRYNCYKKGLCTPMHFLRHKYILSVEGNDKDSGINWKLNSNSLVLMPRPRVTSWLMETTLIPDYHYVLLKDDFSDLYEKYIWCEQNQNKCKEIIKNANIFMKQFENNKNEEKLERDVINKYFELKKKCNK